MLWLIDLYNFALAIRITIMECHGFVVSHCLESTVLCMLVFSLRKKKKVPIIYSISLLGIPPLDFFKTGLICRRLSCPFPFDITYFLLAIIRSSVAYQASSRMFLCTYAPTNLFFVPP